MKKPTSEQIIESTIIVAKAILASDALEVHKRGFMSSCIWMVTESNGKYGVPYWSEGIYELVQREGSLGNVLKLRPLLVRHEHVRPRKYIVEDSMNDQKNVEAILLRDSIACLVTKEEHKKLDHLDTGFGRYEAASIRIWEVKKGQWMDFEEQKNLPRLL